MIKHIFFQGAKTKYPNLIKEAQEMEVKEKVKELLKKDH